MYSAEFVYAAIYLTILLASNLLLVRRWAEGGLFVKPINTSILWSIVFSLLVTCCYGVICMQSYDDVYGRLFYFFVAVYLIPLIWGFVYRTLLMKPGLLELNIALRRMENFETNNYVGYNRSIEEEKNFRENKEIQKNISLIRNSTSLLSIEQKTFVLCGEVVLTSEHIDDFGYFTIDCLHCKEKLKVFAYADEYSVDCSCESKNHFIRNDDLMSIKVKLTDGKIRLMDENRYYLAVANEMLAQNYRLMGEPDQAKSYLDTARFYAGDLHKRFPGNKYYIELLSLIYFRKAQICFMQGDKDNARSYARESLLLNQKICDHENKEIINSLIQKC